MSSGRRSPAAAPVTVRGQAARERIVRAAAELLAETGELEVARVAARAGVSEGLPYRYFRDRSGLISAVIEDFHARLGEAVSYARFDAPTWQQREQRRVAAWVRFLYRDPLSPVILGGLGGDASVAASWQRALSLAIEVGARNIAAGQGAGDLPRGKDARLLAAGVLGGVQAAVAAALATKPRPSERSVADALWTFVRGAAEAAPEKRSVTPKRGQ